MKKIVFVINTLEVGGAAKMLKYVANIATEVFQEVIIIDIYDQTIDSLDLKPSINVKCLGLGKLSRLSRQLRIIGQLRKAIKDESPDCVCSFVGHVNVVARIATIGCDLVFMSAERGDPYTQPFIWKIVTRWAYRTSDYCFFQLKGARDFFDIKTRNKSFIIPNPFVPSDYCNLFKGIRKKTIISAGRFAPEKCYDVLISAFAKVIDIHPEYKLILCGDGPLLSNYKHQIQTLGIEDKVVFPGYVKSVSNAVREEGIFVLSSMYEGIPNSLIEAMSVGIPCIATDCTPGGPRYLMDNGNRGILVPVNNIEKMTSAILYLIENSDIASDLGLKATEIIEVLNESHIRQLWIDTFRKISKKSN